MSSSGAPVAQRAPRRVIGSRAGLPRVGGNIKATSLLSVLLALALIAPAGAVRGSAPAGVSYVESSAGLQPPQWDGGRTEVEMGDVNGDGNPETSAGEDPPAEEKP